MNLTLFAVLAACLYPSFAYASAPLESTASSLYTPGRGPCQNSPTSRACWGNYSIDTDYYSVTPDTGATRGTVQLSLMKVDI